ncbi:MAG: DUF4175 family protein [Candidatus Zixiibacteriota bacterium]
MTEVKSIKALEQRLKNILCKQRLVLFSAGILSTVAVVMLTSLVFSLLANAVVLPVWLKITLLSLAGAVTLTVFWKWSLKKLLGGHIDQVALALEERNPDFKGRLIATVQFARSKTMAGYSRELIDATVRQALEKTDRINFDEAVILYPVWKASRIFGVAAILAILMLVLLPGFFSYAYEVFSNPTTVIAPPLAYRLTPVPASSEWVRFRDIEIGAALFGQRLPDEAIIYHRLAGGSWQKSKIDLKTVKRQSSAAGDSLSFGITLRQVNKSFDYYVEAGRIRTDVQQINVVDRPRVNKINLAIFYPDYTGLAPATINENNGSFSAVVGSRVNMKIETNLPVETAELVFDDSSRIPLKVLDKFGEVSLLVEKSRAYYIYLRDHLGEKNPDPIEYYITAVPDEFPAIDVVRPGFDVNLNDEMILPLKVRIFDDYGFSSLVLKYTAVSQGRPSEENVAVLHFSDRIKTEGDIEFNWDMDKFNLFPGDYVLYYFEVADNDRISGPKITQSRQYIARLPSLDEMLAETEGESRERISGVEQLLKTGEELNERLKNVARKLDSQNKKLDQSDWQQQKELESISGRNQEILQKVQEMSEQMNQSLEKMKENALLSRQIMEKLEEIRKLFQEVATPEMMEAQEKLMEALKNMDRQELQDAMKQFQLSQEEMLQRLERTLSLLKKMQLEQKMEAMILKAEELAKRQEGMNQKTGISDKEQLPLLSQPEKDIKSGLEALKQEVSELWEVMKEAGMDQKPETEKFAEAVEQTDADKNMENMAQSLDRQEKQESIQQGEQALSKLLVMIDEMQKQQMAMSGNDTEAVKRAMRRAIDDANYLSNKQEELLKEAASMNPGSVVVRDLASAQQDIMSSCAGLKNTIAELGKVSPFIAAELEMLVNDAVFDMQEAMTQLDAKQGRNAVSSQTEAMVNLNKAGVRLLESLENQKQCDKAGNCDKNMSMMESLCNKQNALNQKTSNQCNNPQPIPGQEGGREALKRLAGEQGAIRKSLEQLQQEFGNSRQILGRLDDIAREMKKVEEDMAEGAIGQETTERQLKIYSRMLEASRSLQRKDFSEQRQAVTAKDQIFYLPPALSSDILNDRLKFEDKLRQYLGDNYPAQYEEQIKAYFRALLNLQSQLRQPEKQLEMEP